MTRIRLAWMIIVLVVAGIGCSDKNSVPSGILAREDMQRVLWDMIQADQYSAYLAKDSARVSLKLENMRLYDQVFQLHHISREKFTKSYKYYMTNPELTQTLMDSLLAMGNRIRTENYNRPMTRPVSTPPLKTVPALPAPGQKTPAQLTPAQSKPAGVGTLPKMPPGRTPAQKKADSLRRSKLAQP
ncbi:MAG TPA: DUF4296 domain-containing protein [Puia sp.]